MRVVWDETKRQSNISKHGLDFVDVEQLFSGITYTMEDKRFSYREQRIVTLGLLGDTVVVVAHTEDADELRVVSMRKATRNEQAIYFKNF